MTMGEGNTPLIASSRIAPSLFFKLENCNPTGSYKDRFIAAEVARIAASGARACMATSSGNTGSSLAAYCARHGIRCAIFVNERTPEGKLAQMRAHGARVIRVRGFGDDPGLTARIFEDLERLSRERGIPLVVSAFRHCPEAMRAVASIARELREQAGAVRQVFVPVGGGGLFSAVAEGFLECGNPPAIHAVQPEGCSTVVAAFQAGEDAIRPVESRTRVSGLSVPFDIDGKLAISYLRRCGGEGVEVTDEEVFHAQERMLREEGIYCEPAGATALAGFLKLRPDGPAVCLVTGHGFKDPESIARVADGNPAVSIGHEDLEEEAERLR